MHRYGEMKSHGDGKRCVGYTVMELRKLVVTEKLQKEKFIVFEFTIVIVGA